MIRLFKTTACDHSQFSALPPASQQQGGDHALLPVGGRRRRAGQLPEPRPEVAVVRAHRVVSHVHHGRLQRCAGLRDAGGADGSGPDGGEERRSGEQRDAAGGAGDAERGHDAGHAGGIDGADAGADVLLSAHVDAVAALSGISCRVGGVVIVFSFVSNYYLVSFIFCLLTLCFDVSRPRKSMCWIY